MELHADPDCELVGRKFPRRLKIAGTALLTGRRTGPGAEPESKGQSQGASLNSANRSFHFMILPGTATI
jgi:hypothetical protein